MSDQQALLAKIHERRKEIAEQRSDLAHTIDRCRQVDASLEQEDAELAITERNIAKFTGSDLENPVTELGARLVAAHKTQLANRREKRKPDGLPSVLSMAATVLIQRAQEGQIWLEPAEIVTEIKRRWWQRAEHGDIVPQLWRAVKKGLLLKDGSRYALPDNQYEKAPDGIAAGASQSNGAAGSSPA